MTCHYIGKWLICWSLNNITEKGAQKGNYKNPKVQKCRKCEIVVLSKIQIIQKSKSSNMQSWNIKKRYTAFENPQSKSHYS